MTPSRCLPTSVTRPRTWYGYAIEDWIEAIPPGDVWAASEFNPIESA